MLAGHCACTGDIETFCVTRASGRVYAWPSLGEHDCQHYVRSCLRAPPRTVAMAPKSMKVVVEASPPNAKRVKLTVDEASPPKTSSPSKAPAKKQSPAKAPAPKQSPVKAPAKTQSSPVKPPLRSTRPQ